MSAEIKPQQIHKLAGATESTNRINENGTSLNIDFERKKAEFVENNDFVGLYFAEVGKTPLLTREQEVELAKRIESGRTARELFAENPEAENKDELIRFIEDGLAAREHLITANSRLVISVAKKNVGRGIPFLDLIQEGHIGLMRAVKKFDYRRGHKFSTYATWWIRQAVGRAIADQSRTIRIPNYMNDKIRSLLKTKQNLTQELGREPTIEEVASAHETTVREVEQILTASIEPISLERPADSESGSELIDFIKDEKAEMPSKEVENNLLEKDLASALQALTPKEARVLSLRYGLENGRGLTLEKTGQMVGLTRERVRQIEIQALSKLRHTNEFHNLEDYLKD